MYVELVTVSNGLEDKINKGELNISKPKSEVEEVRYLDLKKLIKKNCHFSD